MPYSTYRRKSSLRLFEETDNSAEGNVNRRLNLPALRNCPLGTSRNYLTEERKDEDRSVENTFTAVQYKEKESRDDQMDRAKQVKTVDDNKLATDS